MKLRLVLVALALVFAGCASPADDTAAPASEPGSGAVPATPSLDDGSKPMSPDVGAMPHLHDYWSGRERVTLFKGAVEPSFDETMNATIFRVWLQKQPMVGGTGFNLPAGNIVFEGTGIMEMTATYDAQAATSLGVSYRSAAGPEWSAVQALPTGQALTIPVTPVMSDMPHSQTSRWGFVFSPAEPGAVVGAFELQIDIVKVRDVAEFPGHPDLFGDETELPLHDATHDFSEVSYPRRTPNLLLTGQFGESEVTPAHIVPMETMWIRAVVDITRAESTPGEVVDVKFFFRGADRNYIDYPFLRPIEGSFDSKHMVFEFPVTMDMTDSPYATESQWRFFVEPSVSIAGEDPSGGTTDTEFSYHLTLTAYDHERETASELVQRGEG